MEELVTNASGQVVYRINDRDEICFVSQGYEEFAAANPGAAAAVVLHRPLWDFITEPTTQHLYRQVLALVRKGRRLRFRLRCDSPDRRRLLEMEVVGGEGGAVEFRSRTVAEEPRPPQPLLDPDTPRSEELLRMCGWCKKVHVGTAWAEVEEAVALLRLFELSALPAITHGICEGCCQAIMDTLESS